ncbi:MAG: glycosyltransferase [Sphingobium sp.]
MNKYGGCEENTWASCVHQAESGHKVHLVCGATSDIDAYRNRHPLIDVHCLEEMVWNISLRSDIAACRRLKSLFKQLGADVVHTHSSKAGILGRIAGRMAGVPLVVHGVHILPFSNVKLTQKIVYLGAEHVVGLMTDHFIHVSNGTKAIYDMTRVGKGKPHSVVRSGMEVEKFRNAPWPADWRELIDTEKAEDKPVTVLMLAVLEGRKRHAEFLREFASISPPGEKIRILLAGDGPERRRLETLVFELGVSDRVKLLGNRSDPEKLIALSDFSVLASVREGLPRSIIQSLAGGRPVVVSPFRGIGEVVKDHENGVIVASRMAEEVARETVLLARSPERLELYRNGAQQTSVDDWAFQNMFGQLDAAYLKSFDNADVAKRFQQNKAERQRALASTA